MATPPASAGRSEIWWVKVGMAKKNPMAVSFAEFMRKYARDIALHEAAEQRSGTGNSLAAALAGELVPGRLIFSPADFWEEVRRWWPVCLLQQAAREKDAEAYKRLLHYL